MATSLPSLRSPIVSSAAPPNPSSNRRSTTNNWWSPLFAWPAEPDYINGGVRSGSDSGQSGRIGTEKSVFRGCFTEEKAKEMRKKTIESSSFHDVMYHSAIASRLASDVSGR